MDDKKSVYTVPPDMRKKFMMFGLKWQEMIIFGVAFCVGVAILFNFGFGSAAVAAMVPVAVFLLFHRPDDNLPERNMFNTAVKVIKYNFTTQYFSIIPQGQIAALKNKRGGKKNAKGNKC